MASAISTAAFLDRLHHLKARVSTLAIACLTPSYPQPIRDAHTLVGHVIGSFLGSPRTLSWLSVPGNRTMEFRGLGSSRTASSPRERVGWEEGEKPTNGWIPLPRDDPRGESDRPWGNSSDVQDTLARPIVVEEISRFQSIPRRAVSIFLPIGRGSPSLPPGPGFAPPRDPSERRHSTSPFVRGNPGSSQEPGSGGEPRVRPLSILPRCPCIGMGFRGGTRTAAAAARTTRTRVS